MTKTEKKKLLQEYRVIYPDAVAHSLPTCSRCLSMREGAIIAGQMVCFQCIKDELEELGIVIEIIELPSNSRKKKAIVYRKGEKTDDKV